MSLEIDARLIEKFGMILANRDSKKRWGMKIMREIRNPKRYAEVWNAAQFIHIIRDGRDVASSQLMGHGSWGYGDVEEAAKIGAILLSNPGKTHQGSHMQK